MLLRAEGCAMWFEEISRVQKYDQQQNKKQHTKFRKKIKNTRKSVLKGQ